MAAVAAVVILVAAVLIAPTDRRSWCGDISVVLLALVVARTSPDVGVLGAVPAARRQFPRVCRGLRCGPTPHGPGQGGGGPGRRLPRSGGGAGRLCWAHLALVPHGNAGAGTVASVNDADLFGRRRPGPRSLPPRGVGDGPLSRGSFGWLSACALGACWQHRAVAPTPRSPVPVCLVPWQRYVRSSSRSSPERDSAWRRSCPHRTRAACHGSERSLILALGVAAVGHWDVDSRNRSPRATDDRPRGALCDRRGRVALAPRDRPYGPSPRAIRTGPWSGRPRSHQWATAPIVGVGPDRLLQFHASDGTFAHFVHNEFLQIAADGGIVGVVLLGACSAFRHPSRRRVLTCYLPAPRRLWCVGQLRQCSTSTGISRSSASLGGGALGWHTTTWRK